MKNGSKILRDGLRIHPLARVVDGEHRVAARRKVDLPFRSDLGRRHFESEQATVGHRIPGVHCEVRKHLLDLTAVGADVDGVARHDGVEVDVLADHPPQKLVHVADDLVQIEDLGLEHLPAAESKELVRESRGALGGLDHLLDLF